MPHVHPAHLKPGDGRRFLLWQAMGSPRMTTLYYSAFGMYVFVSILYRTVYGAVPAGAESVWAGASKFLTGLCAGLLLIKILFQSYTKRQALLIGVTGVLVLVNLVVSRWTLLVWISLFVVAAKGVAIRRLAKLSAAIVIPIAVLTVILALVGVVENYQVTNIAGRTTLLGGMSRYSLGFIHPNALASIALDIILSLLILTEKHGKKTGIILSALIGVVVYAITDSRGLLLVLVVVLALQGILLVNRESLKKYALNGIVAMYVAVVIFSILSAVLYSPSNKLAISINKMMSNRIVFPHDFLVQGLLSPFGAAESAWPNKPDAQGVNQFVIDNSYFFSIAAFGLILGTLFLVALLLLLLDARREKNLGPTTVGFTAFLVMGFMERTMLMVCINYFIIALSCLLYGCRIYVLDDGEWPADGVQEISLMSILTRKNRRYVPKHQACSGGSDER